jgi:hypothetical protein
MRPIRKTLNSATSTAPIPLNIHADSFEVSLTVSLPAGSSLTYTVEYTVDDVFDNEFNPATATWFPVTGLSAQTISASGNLVFPVTAVRMRVSTFTSGSATLTLIQSGISGS